MAMKADKHCRQENLAADRTIINIPQDDPVDFKQCDFLPTDAVPGSAQKVEVMAYRHAHGLPLWHEEDRLDYAGIGMLCSEEMEAAKGTSGDRKRAGKTVLPAETPALQTDPPPSAIIEVAPPEISGGPVFASAELPTTDTAEANPQSVLENAGVTDAIATQQTDCKEKGEEASCGETLSLSPASTLTMPAVSAMTEEIQRLYEGLQQSVAEGLLEPGELALFLREAGIDSVPSPDSIPSEK